MSNDDSTGEVTSMNTPDPDRRFREAQKSLWADGVALEGPDTDALTGDDRGVHFSAKGPRDHALLWADKVGAYLDKALAMP